MRITSIQVDGFGSLQGKLLDTDAPLVLFYGANEAGKSTLMGFVRAVLFGFPPRQGRSERYEPLGGGAHGGALTLLDEQGQRIRVERYDAPAAGGKRASAGLVKVTLGDGTIGGEELLNTLLGGLSAELFRSLFAFGLTELQELRTLQTDELSGYLYSAGLGVSGSAIMEAERKLAAQADSLYKPRGRNQEINRLLKELEGLEQALRRSRDHAAGYDGLQEERRSAEQRIAGLEQRQEAQRAELHKIGLAVKGRSGWVRLRQIGRELAALPARPGFPEHASARLGALEAELERAEAERTRLTIKQQGLQLQLQELKLLPAELLAHQVELNYLLEQASTYEEQQRSVTELRVEREHLRMQLSKLLREIDERWDEKHVAAFPVSISLRERVRSFKEQFRTARADELRVRTELEGLQRQRDRYHDQIRGLEADLHRQGISVEARRAGLVDAAEMLQRLARDYAKWQLLIREVQHHQERQAERQRHQQQLEEAAAQSKAASKRMQQRLVALSSLFTMLLPSWLLWQVNWQTAAVAFVVLAAVTWFAFASSRTAKPRVKRAERAVVAWHALTGEPESTGAGSGKPAEMKRAEEELRQLERSLQEQLERLYALRRHDPAMAETAAAAGTSWTRRGAAAAVPLQELQPHLEAWLREEELTKQQRSEHVRQLEKLKDAQEQLAQLREQEEERSAAWRQLGNAHAQLQAEWGEWLESLAMSDRLSPDAALETIQAVEHGHELLRQQHKLDAKLASYQTAIHQYEQKLIRLLGLSAGMKEPLLGLKRWKEQEQEQLQQLEVQQRLQQQLAEGEQELLAVQEDRQRLLERLQQLLAEGSAADGEALRKHEREQVERSKLRDEETALQAHLESLLGSSQLPDFAALMESHGEEDLTQRYLAVESELVATTEEANQLRQEVGRLSGMIGQLEQGTEHADRLLQVEALRAAVAQQVEHYAVASFASLLMKKARDVYERERQPGVLQQASVYFEQMTNGRFVQIKAPFGEQRLIVIRAGGQALETHQLSRGTAEQLYLSMRFALAQEYAGRAVLPLVMDDILVNFDEERMESCLRVMADVSQRHQVLLFTCHAHVRDAAARLLGSSRFIEL
ncbi:AAA family ATPase [Paenibacillus aestuarii]|uniref:AAA family ATPase n=1 Tax=Paenibacillus aestuarii TaxID=516965 RepID=A0ABW0KGV1_9BACL|nr:AAA family ATPase [Paenibacillus aestuarii]